MIKYFPETLAISAKRGIGKVSGNTGFTLIELIMVVVILGILAAFALPKFTNLSSDARRAAIESAHGAIQSVTKLTHAQAQINFAGVQNANIDFEGNTIAIYRGYPGVANKTGSLTIGITTLAGIDENSYRITRSGYIGNSNDTVRIEPPGSSDATNCYTQFVQSVAQDVPPAITLDISGC